jgi:hypothetical protein
MRRSIRNPTLEGERQGFDLDGAGLAPAQGAASLAELFANAELLEGRGAAVRVSFAAVLGLRGLGNRRNSISSIRRLLLLLFLLRFLLLLLLLLLFLLL